MNGKVQFVLYLGEKHTGGWRVLIIVHAGSIDIRNLLVKPPLTKPDFPDFFQQTLKIVLTKKGAILHALLVQHIALDSELPQYLSSPLAKLGCPHRVDPVAHRDNDIEVVEVCVVLLTIRSSYSEFPNN